MKKLLGREKENKVSGAEGFDNYVMGQEFGRAALETSDKAQGLKVGSIVLNSIEMHDSGGVYLNVYSLIRELEESGFLSVEHIDTHARISDLLGQARTEVAAQAKQETAIVKSLADTSTSLIEQGPSQQ